ncbi:hypothetical protein IGI37_003507 [Enterococcus sp. AZ194]|uniref:Gfo/Idh/MocA family protein n=1 Tax=Enterococcus sp. AZ194 TaxID=2774629 RepID=UPI003F27C4DE
MITFGIIGCGNIAGVHAEAIERIEGAQLLAVCDNNPKKGQQFAEMHATDFYQEYKDLLADERIQVIIIATPHYLHKQMTVDSFSFNKHVICEKPMATTVSDAKEIYRQQSIFKKEYVVCYQNRFNASFIKLKERIENQSFGKLKGIRCEMSWHRDASYYAKDSWKGTWKEEGGGLLINQAIHTLDVVPWFIKCPQKIKGKIMQSLLEDDIEVEDAAMGTAMIDEQIPVVIYASNNFSSDRTPSVLFDFEGATVELTNKELFINGQKVPLMEEKQSYVSKEYWGNGHQRLIQTFVNKLTGVKDPYLSYLACEDAIDSLKMVCGIYDSDRNGKWMNLTN